MLKIIRIFFLFLFILTSLIVLIDYPGSKLIYLIFSIISLFYLKFMFRKKSIMFDKFIGLFLFLGLWFNFSIKIKLKTIFPDGFGDFKYWFSDGVGLFDFSQSSIDKVLIISLISFISICLASFIRQFFFYYTKNSILNYEENFYNKNRFLFILSFVCLIIILSYTNFYFKIYQRGLINDYGFLINSIFTFLFLLFLPAIATMIINYEFHTRKSLKISIFTSVFEAFFNSYSILSRNFIFNPLSNLLAIYKLNKLKKKFKQIHILFFFFIIILFFLISVVVVSKERNEFSLNKIDNLKKSELSSEEDVIKKKTILLRSSERVFKIFISRLIGVEGIMAVSSSDKLSFDLFYLALNEKFIRGESSFYDKFKNESRTDKDCKNTNQVKDNCNINSISLMGIIAFLYYPGSYLFLFGALLLVCIFCSFVEIVTYKISNNMVLVSLISQILAYRLWHFGYLPSNSYKLLLSICFIVILIYFYRKIISKIQI